MKQLELGLDESQKLSLKNVWRHSLRVVTTKFPQPVDGESLDEFNEFRVCEFLLELSENIRQIALERQSKAINFLYEKEDDETA